MNDRNDKSPPSCLAHSELDNWTVQQRDRDEREGPRMRETPVTAIIRACPGGTVQQNSRDVNGEDLDGQRALGVAATCIPHLVVPRPKRGVTKKREIGVA